LNIKLLSIAGLFLAHGFFALYEMASDTRPNHIYIPLDSIALLIGLGVIMRLRIAQISGVIFATFFLILSTVSVFSAFSVYTFLPFCLYIWVIFAIFSRDIREEFR